MHDSLTLVSSSDSPVALDSEHAGARGKMANNRTSKLILEETPHMTRSLCLSPNDTFLFQGQLHPISLVKTGVRGEIYNVQNQADVSP